MKFSLPVPHSNLSAKCNVNYKYIGVTYDATKAVAITDLQYRACQHANGQFCRINAPFQSTKIFQPFSFTMPTLPATLQHAFFKMENSLFTPHLDELFNLWNNAVCQMNYWVCTAGRYGSTSILERVHKAFFNYYQFNAVTCMLDEIIYATMIITLDLEFERALYNHDEGYEHDNDYGLPILDHKAYPCLLSIHNRGLLQPS